MKIIEEPQFQTNGPRIDASRNAVIKVDSLKIMLRKMALMGLNMMMLYTEDILLVGKGKTYEFIENMIKNACEPFRSNRIHIGMDEAHNLGLGRYIDINGYRKRFDIMNEHLHKVLEITAKYNLKPMIWSDMYFRLASKSGDYYDLNAHIPKEVIKDIPKEVALVY